MAPSSYVCKLGHWVSGNWYTKTVLVNGVLLEITPLCEPAYYIDTNSHLGHSLVPTSERRKLEVGGVDGRKDTYAERWLFRHRQFKSQHEYYGQQLTSGRSMKAALPLWRDRQILYYNDEEMYPWSCYANGSQVSCVGKTIVRLLTVWDLSA